MRRVDRSSQFTLIPSATYGDLQIVNIHSLVKHRMTNIGLVTRLELSSRLQRRVSGSGIRR